MSNCSFLQFLFFSHLKKTQFYHYDENIVVVSVSRNIIQIRLQSSQYDFPLNIAMIFLNVKMESSLFFFIYCRKDYTCMYRWYHSIIYLYLHYILISIFHLYIFISNYLSSIFYFFVWSNRFLQWWKYLKHFLVIRVQWLFIMNDSKRSWKLIILTILILTNWIKQYVVIK